MSIKANTVILLKYNSMESALNLYVMVDIRMLWAAYELYKAVARSCTMAAVTSCTMASAKSSTMAAAKSCTMAAVTSCMKAAFDCISIAWRQGQAVAHIA